MHHIINLQRIYRSFIFQGDKCYLSSVLDMYSNKIVGYVLSQTSNLEQINRMLAMTFANTKNKKDIIFHSDMG